MDEEELLDLIDRWHDDDCGECELYEFLGWTEEEYATWVKTGVIPDILSRMDSP
jgi:hypothetical protein